MPAKFRRRMGLLGIGALALFAGFRFVSPVLCASPRVAVTVASGAQVLAPPAAAPVVSADRNDAAQHPDEASFSSVRARFLAFGDGGLSDDNEYAVARTMQARCRRDGCDLGLGLGDNFYPVGVQSVTDPKFRTAFEIPYAPIGAPMYMILGNHDYFGNPDAEVAYAKLSPSQRWIMPRRYYTFFVGGIRFLALDTNQPNEQQEAWASKVLTDSQRNKEPWVIAFGHHPHQSYGGHQMPEEPLAGFLDRVLCGHADVYFAGHDHDKQVLQPRCGVIQVVSGTAGQLRPTNAGPKTVWARSSLGFAYANVTGPEMKLCFIDMNGKDEFEVRIVRKTAARLVSAPATVTPAAP